MSDSFQVEAANDSANGGEHIVYSMNELEEKAQGTDKRTKVGKSWHFFQKQNRVFAHECIYCQYNSKGCAPC